MTLFLSSTNSSVRGFVVMRIVLGNLRVGYTFRNKS